ncbi:hypothetical protein [Prescottella agglutinans]|uniref:hypothetical protein n=1 Tax=Prescottella agglutinans TaxID=1644129 RepID=UPI002475E36F|nr:hypothetical protein [Prescottella agglutinans]
MSTTGIAQAALTAIGATQAPLTAVVAAIGTTQAALTTVVATVGTAQAALTAIVATVGTTGAPLATIMAAIGTTQAALTAIVATVGTTGAPLATIMAAIGTTQAALTAIVATVGTTGAPLATIMAAIGTTGAALTAIVAAVGTAVMAAVGAPLTRTALMTTVGAAGTAQPKRGEEFRIQRCTNAPKSGFGGGVMASAATAGRISLPDRKRADRECGNRRRGEHDAGLRLQSARVSAPVVRHRFITSSIVLHRNSMTIRPNRMNGNSSNTTPMPLAKLRQTPTDAPMRIGESNLTSRAGNGR